MCETRLEHGETTLVVEAARLVDACVHLRDEEGFNFLADLTPTDYLGWGRHGVAGYIGTAGGRDLNQPGSQGYAKRPDPKPKRFSVNYHLLELSATPRAKNDRRCQITDNIPTAMEAVCQAQESVSPPSRTSR